MKEKLLLLTSLLLSSSAVYALEGNLKVGGNLDIEFKSYEDDETTKDINEKRFDYNKTGYDLELVNLKLLDKKFGFNFGTVLKSSRKNLLINDWSNEQYNKSESRKSKNHDVQGKLFVNWESLNKEDQLTGKAGIEYYLDNYFKKIARDNDNIVTENTYDYEFIENEDKKYLGGDVKLNAGIGYSIIKGLKIQNDTEYYANKLVDYKKGYPYVKTMNKLIYDITDKSKFEFSHDFNFNLRSLAQAYVEEQENEENEEYLFLDNFVRRYKQKADIKYTLTNNRSEKEEDKYEISSNFKDDGYFIGGPRYLDPREIENHRLELNVIGKASNEFLFKDKYKLNLKNSLLLENKAETAYYISNNRNEVWSYIAPTYNLGLSSEIQLGNFKLIPEINEKTRLIFPLKKGIFNKEYFMNKHTLDLNLKAIYNKDKLENSFEIKNNSEISVIKDKISKITAKFEQKFDTKYEYKNNLKLNLLGSNIFDIATINDVQGRIYLDTLKGKYNIKGGLDYTIFNNNDQKLNILSNLGLNNEYEYGFILDGGRVPYIPPKEKPENNEEVTITDKTEIEYPSPNSLSSNNSDDLANINIFKNDYDINVLNPSKRDFTNSGKLLIDIQRYLFDFELKYSNNFNKFNLLSSLKLDAELDLIALVKEKKSKLRNDEKDELEKRIDLITSLPGEMKYNIGGKIVITPNTSLKYNFTDNLSLEGKMELPIEFSKLVINKITDKNRTDKDTYGPKDRNFELRKIAPKVGFELNYKW